jgi:coenzyme F420 hydrogenase subunit beta
MKSANKIEEIVRNDLCHGCGTCASMCRQSAIDLVVDRKKGIYLPKININRCNHCGICFKVCPGSSVPFHTLNLEIFGKDSENYLLGNYNNCYIGFARDYDMRFRSSSGGLVTTLLVYALEKGMIDGALVTRMSQKQPLEPEPFIARTRNEIIQAARSKYCPVPANLAIKQILENDGKYAVVGLPCHIHGIRKAEQLNAVLKQRIVLTLGIFCANTVSFHGTEQLLNKHGIAKENIQTIEYRGNGWPGNMTIELKANGRRLTIPYAKYSDGHFLAFTPWRCKLCIDHAAELADISFGDAWLPEIRSKDEIGTSMIVTRNKKGEDFVQDALKDGLISLEQSTAGDVLKAQDGFSYKKKLIIGRFKISSILRKITPDYGIRMASSTLGNEIIAITDYLKNVLAARRSTWWLLKIYCTLLSSLRNFLSRRKIA